MKGKGVNGILPAPLTAPPANGATSTLAPAVDGGDVGQMASTVALREGFCTDVVNFRVA